MSPQEQAKPRRWRCLGHHSAAFTLDTYGHLMDRLPVQPVEWIDDLVFPEGLDAALKVRLSAALSGEIAGHVVQSSEERKPKTDATSSDPVHSGAAGCVVGRAGLEPATLGLRVPCTASCANGPEPFNNSKTRGKCKRELMCVIRDGHASGACCARAWKLTSANGRS